MAAAEEWTRALKYVNQVKNNVLGSRFNQSMTTRQHNGRCSVHTDRRNKRSLTRVALVVLIILRARDRVDSGLRGDQVRPAHQRLCDVTVQGRHIHPHSGTADTQRDQQQCHGSSGGPPRGSLSQSIASVKGRKKTSTGFRFCCLFWFGHLPSKATIEFH